MFELSSRERIILRSVVNSFIVSANPIGSRALAECCNLGLSPATVRNTMADLEALGLLEQPHTSAGRIPTNLGYRFYVDDLMERKKLVPWERELIDKCVAEVKPNINDLLQRAAEILGKLSSLLGIVFSSNFKQGILKKIDLTKLSDDKLLVVVTLKLGMVKTILLELTFPLQNYEIEETCRLLNERLSGLLLSRVRQEIGQRVRNLPPNSRKDLVTLFVNNADSLFCLDAENDLHFTGFRTLLNQPEFNRADRVRTVVGLMEDKRVLIHIVGDVRPEEGVKATIGEESRIVNSRDLSVISSAFIVGNTTGTVNILGPTRMDYPKLFAIIDYTVKAIDKQFNK